MKKITYYVSQIFKKQNTKTVSIAKIISFVSHITRELSNVTSRSMIRSLMDKVDNFFTFLVEKIIPTDVDLNKMTDKMIHSKNEILLLFSFLRKKKKSVQANFFSKHFLTENEVDEIERFSILFLKKLLYILQYCYTRNEKKSWILPKNFV